MINKIINHLFSQKIFIWNHYLQRHHEFQSAKGHFVWHWRGKVEYKHLAMSLFKYDFYVALNILHINHVSNQ